MKGDSAPEGTPVLVGHPFSPGGRGEDVRSTFRALTAVGFPVCIRDIYGVNPKTDPDMQRSLTPHLVRNLSTTLNIFFINGDEVEAVLKHVREDWPQGAYNVICPAWELSRYPDEWGRQLGRFDEVLSLSRFSFDSLHEAVSNAKSYVPLASQVEISSYLGRRYFGIPESSFVFLFFFDFTSYMERKNPSAVFRAFERLCAQTERHDTRLVVKLNGSASRSEDFQRFRREAEDCRVRDRVVIIDKTLTNNEIKNLIRCCDCFVSLHRSEGFGRGMAEAMYLGKPVIATGYSGNMDFMNNDNSCLVDFKLVPVLDGQYPHGRGQVWADPDIDHAAWYMNKVLGDRDYGRRLGAIGSRHIRQFFSYRAIGIRYQSRIESILTKQKQAVIFPNTPKIP